MKQKTICLIITLMFFLRSTLNPSQNVSATAPFMDHTLAWNAFFGGMGFDQGSSMAVDDQGNVYVLGISTSSWGEDPITPWNNNGQGDVFIAKVDSHGRLLWHTFMGSPGRNEPATLILDDAGNIYVSGSSSQSWGNPVHGFNGGERDGFIAKLNPNGVRLWHTFIGSAAKDMVTGIQLDDNLGIYTVGFSQASWGSPRENYHGGGDGFLAYLNADSGQLTWNTFIGSADADTVNRIALDEQGNLYITGSSVSSWGNPVIPFPENSGQQAFAARMNSAGSVTWNTFLGGANVFQPADQGLEIALDGTGHVFVLGSSVANWGNPIVPFHGSGNDQISDGFVARLDKTSGVLQWNTFIGGNLIDYVNGIIIEPASGGVYLTGSKGPFYIGFVMQLSNEGAQEWYQAIGYTPGDLDPERTTGTALALDGRGNLYLTGVTPDNNHWGACVRDPFTGNGDMMLLRFGPIDPSDPVLQIDITELKYTALYNGAAPEVQTIAISNCSTGSLSFSAAETGSWLSLAPAAGNAPDDLVVSVNPAGLSAGVYTSAILIESNTPVSPQVVTVQMTIMPFAWNTFIGSTQYDTIRDTVMDAVGNIYITGYSEAAWGTPILPYQGDHDVFVLKLSQAGSVEWLTFLGSTGRDTSQSIQLDTAGNIYITGTSDSTWGTPINPITSKDGFLAKLAPNGNLLWNTFFGSPNDQYPYDFPTALTLDGDQAIYVLGTSTDTWGEPLSPYWGEADIFIARFSAEGVRQWNTFWGSDLFEYAGDLIADGNGNLFLTGSGRADWISAGTPVNPHADDGGYPANDMIVARLSTTGELGWYTFWGFPLSDENANTLILDDNGNLYIGGECSESCFGTTVDGEENLGDYDGVLAKYKALDGEQTWLRYLGNHSESDAIYALTKDGEGNIWAAGYSGGDWGLSQFYQALTPYQGEIDAFFSSITPDGQRSWHTFAGSPYHMDIAQSIILNSNGNLILAGNSYDQWGSPTNPHAGGWDGFIAGIGNFQLPPPILNITPTALTLRAILDGEEPFRAISITNGSITAMTYTAEENTSWLSIDIPTGNVPGTITVQTHTSGLVAGTYHGQITITGSNGAQNSPQIIPVTLEIASSSVPSRFQYLPLIRR